jgi:hypothetical protein
MSVVHGRVESTFDWLGLADESAGDGQLSFDSKFFDLAQNHQEGNTRGEACCDSYRSRSAI